MTTIAFKDGIMASDSCISGGGYYGASVNKVQRTSAGALIGWCGEADNRAVLTLIDKVKKPAQLPTKQEIAACLTDCQVLIAFGPNSLYIVGCDEDDSGRYHGYVNVCNLGAAAIGSGSHLALGAMLAGKSAREAVSIACKIDNNSKLPVNSMSFTPKTTKPKPPRPK
jgi:ATP-dependent protease HslVU (ClpYQ) peptidase subunit